jgi:IS30 family transposase
MRTRRRTPAGGVQAEKQRRYAQLIAQGLGSSEACRVVGIDRKTGNRWRYGGRSGIPPERLSSIRR